MKRRGKWVMMGLPSTTSLYVCLWWSICLLYVCMSVSVPFLCISAWLRTLSCVYPQCVCSLGHGTSACMPSIQLWEGGVVIVGLSIFHVLLACLFPPSNSLWGEKKKEKKKNTRPMLWFFIVSAPFWRFIYFLFFSSGSVFVLGAAFLLPSRIFRVKGSLCALLHDLRFWKKVHWRDGMWGDEEREGGKEKKREMKGERKGDREGRKRLGGEAWTKASYQSC